MAAGGTFYRWHASDAQEYRPPRPTGYMMPHMNGRMAHLGTTVVLGNTVLPMYTTDAQRVADNLRFFTDAPIEEDRNYRDAWDIERYGPTGFVGSTGNWAMLSNSKGKFVPQDLFITRGNGEISSFDRLAGHDWSLPGVRDIRVPQLLSNRLPVIDGTRPGTVMGKSQGVAWGPNYARGYDLSASAARYNTRNNSRKYVFPSVNGLPLAPNGMPRKTCCHSCKKGGVCEDKH